MSGIDIEELAELLAERLEARHELCGPGCGLTDDEQDEVRSLLKTKKSSVRVFLWLTGALMVWILKDVYVWIINHLAFRLGS